MEQLTGVLSPVRGLDGSLSAQRIMTATLSVPDTVEPERYAGPYEFTPTAQTQEIQIEWMMATQNIVINPIPNNYGLIAWNGSALTVS